MYKWLHRFNAAGLDGLADLPRPGVPRRISEHERGRIIQLAGSQTPGRLQQGGEGLLAPDQPKAPAHWTLDALAEAAQAEGIRVGPQPGPPDPAARGRPLATDPVVAITGTHTLQRIAGEVDYADCWRCWPPA